MNRCNSRPLTAPPTLLENHDRDNYISNLTLSIVVRSYIQPNEAGRPDRTRLLPWL